jgi:hypothetical protein
MAQSRLTWRKKNLPTLYTFHLGFPRSNLLTEQLNRSVPRTLGVACNMADPRATPGLCCKQRASRAMSGIISPKGSPGHDISQPFQVAPFPRPDHPAVRALVSASLPQLLGSGGDERGPKVDHTTLYRWVQKYPPEMGKCCKPHLKQTNDSWRVDATYSTLKGMDVPIPGSRLGPQHPRVPAQ